MSQDYLVMAILPLPPASDLNIFESRQIQIRRLPDASEAGTVRLRIQQREEDRSLKELACLQR